jgi:hypothetical protein
LRFLPKPCFGFSRQPIQRIAICHAAHLTSRRVTVSPKWIQSLETFDMFSQ